MKNTENSQNIKQQQNYNGYNCPCVHRWHCASHMTQSSHLNINNNN